MKPRRYPLGCVVYVKGQRGVVKAHVASLGRFAGDPIYRLEVEEIGPVSVRESEITAREGAAA